MEKYLVMSFSEETNQIFWDLSAGRTPDSAIKKVMKKRPYAVVDGAFTAKELRETVKRLESATVGEILSDLDQLEAE